MCAASDNSERFGRKLVQPLRVSAFGDARFEACRGADPKAHDRLGGIEVIDQDVAAVTGFTNPQFAFAREIERRQQGQRFEDHPAPGKGCRYRLSHDANRHIYLRSPPEQFILDREARIILQRQAAATCRVGCDHLSASH
jgi:hypothetical protein